jgi:acetyltransferase-like isoleucine patch superfamily enzyme
MNSFYLAEELKELGFKTFGTNVQVSRKASLYGVQRISIGSHVRIDDFCVLSAGSGGIEIGNFVHIAVFASLMGSGKISLGDFSGISSRVSIYSSNDDYTGEFMSNPTVPAEFTRVTSADVSIGKHALVGAGAIILPGVTMHEGSVLGALSLATKDCESFCIYTGKPALKIVKRSRLLLEKEKKLLTVLNVSGNDGPGPI